MTKVFLELFPHRDRHPTFTVENRAVGAEVLLVVPRHVPALPRSRTAAFTPNAGHANLHKHSNVT